MSRKNGFKKRQLLKNLQEDLQKYISDARSLPVLSIVKDPYVVHSLQDVIYAYEEENAKKELEKVSKICNKAKRKGENYENKVEKAFIKAFNKKAACLFHEEPKIKKETIKINESNLLFPLNPFKEKIKVNGIFSDHILRFKKLQEISDQNISYDFVRRFSVSPSHASCIKKLDIKLENDESLAIKLDNSLNNTSIILFRILPFKNNSSPLNEILNSTSFKNGIIKTKNNENLKLNTNLKPNTNLKQEKLNSFQLIDKNSTSKKHRVESNEFYKRQ